MSNSQHSSAPQICGSEAAPLQVVLFQQLDMLNEIQASIRHYIPKEIQDEIDQSDFQCPPPISPINVQDAVELESALQDAEPKTLVIRNIRDRQRNQNPIDEEKLIHKLTGEMKCPCPVKILRHSLHPNRLSLLMTFSSRRYRDVFNNSFNRTIETSEVSHYFKDAEVQTKLSTDELRILQESGLFKSKNLLPLLRLPATTARITLDMMDMSDMMMLILNGKSTANWVKGNLLPKVKNFILEFPRMEEGKPYHWDIIIDFHNEKSLYWEITNDKSSEMRLGMVKVKIGQKKLKTRHSQKFGVSSLLSIASEKDTSVHRLLNWLEKLFGTRLTTIRSFMDSIEEYRGIRSFYWRMSSVKRLHLLHEEVTPFICGVLETRSERRKITNFASLFDPDLTLSFTNCLFAHCNILTSKICYLTADEILEILTKRMKDQNFTYMSLCLESLLPWDIDQLKAKMSLEPFPANLKEIYKPKENVHHERNLTSDELLWKPMKEDLISTEQRLYVLRFRTYPDKVVAVNWYVPSSEAIIHDSESESDDETEDESESESDEE